MARKKGVKFIDLSGSKTGIKSEIGEYIKDLARDFGHDFVKSVIADALTKKAGIKKKPKVVVQPAAQLSEQDFDFYSMVEIDAIVAGYLKIDGSNANQNIDIGLFSLKTVGFLLYDAGDDKTLTLIHDRVYGFTTGNSTITIHTDGNDHEMYFSQWVGHKICNDQDLRHNASSGAEFAKLKITGTTPTLLRKLQLGDTGRAATTGRWVLDSVGLILGIASPGSDGYDGEGHYFECAIGQASQYEGTSGDGGGFEFKIGTKGIGQSGAADGVDGNFVVKNLPTSDPSVAGALWNDSGTVKISAG